MGFLSSLFGGGGNSTTVTQNATTTAQVDVSTQITNILNLDALAGVFQELGQLFASSSAATGQAIGQASNTQASATWAAAILNASVQQEAERERRALAEKWLKHLITAIFVLGGVWVIMKGTK